MKKLWIAVAAVIPVSLGLVMPANAATTSNFAAPTSVTVSSVTTTAATVKFVLPSADKPAPSEYLVVYPAAGGPSAPAFRGTVTSSPVTATGLKPSTSYYAEVSVDAGNGYYASPWTVSAEFTTAAATASTSPTPTPTPTTPTPTPTPTPTTPTPTPTPTTPTPTPTPTTPTPTPTPTSTSSATVPYAPALSSYTTLAQSYSASDIINDGWAQDANNTNEGNTTCPVANTTYSSSLDAVVLTTTGQPSTNNTACAHIRSQYTVPTSGDVVEAKIWLPSLSSAQTFDGSSYPAGTLIDWATMWTDGANTTDGTESWPADTEVDAVETQYGVNYLTDHYASGTWTTLPKGWAGAGATYATPNAGVPNVQPGWNVVDIEFTSTVANIYFNGALYITIPASALSHDPAYLDFGISGSNGNDPNNPTWPSGPATEDVQYVKVFG
jgi:hypothetical protein